VCIYIYVYMVKVKLSLCLTKHHATKTLGEWRYSSTPRPLYPQVKSLLYPFDRRLGGSHSRSGHSVGEKKSQPPQGIESLSSGRPIYIANIIFKFELSSEMFLNINTNRIFYVLLANML
jgi:hypothetical protein